MSTINNRSAGFTLFEVLVVLAIVASLVMVAQQALFINTTGTEFRVLVQRIVSELRMHRERAILEGSLVSISNEDVRALATLFTNASHKAVEGALMVAIDDGVDVLWFAPDGTTSGGSVVISLNDRSVRVTIDWLTGHVFVAP